MPLSELKRALFCWPQRQRRSCLNSVILASRSKTTSDTTLCLYSLCRIVILRCLGILKWFKHTNILILYLPRRHPSCLGQPGCSDHSLRLQDLKSLNLLLTSPVKSQDDVPFIKAYRARRPSCCSKVSQENGLESCAYKRTICRRSFQGSGETLPVAGITFRMER